jgi:hypothetical protein
MNFAGGTSVVTLSEPGFVGTLKNVTVPEGREVVLSCSVKNLDGHKVGYIHRKPLNVITVNVISCLL